MKKNIKEKIFNAIKNLLAPLDGKPALVSALVLTATIAALDEYDFACFLLGMVFLLTHFFRRHIQWVIFITMAAGIVAHEGFLGIWQPIDSRVVGKTEMISNSGCGTIESRLPRPKGTAFIINVSQENTDGKSYGTAKNTAREVHYKVRLTEKRKILELPEPGDSLCYEASWYPVTPPSVPGAFDTQGWLNSQGLAAYGKFKRWTAHRGDWTFERSFFKFRQFLQRRFAKFLDPAETGLLMGLLAGDRSGIPEVLRSDFQRSGLVHVLAISGFHVVLLAGMLMVFLKATGLPHKIVILIATALLAIYVPVTGGSPAVRRAVMMFAIPQIGTLFGKPANTLNSLGVALLLIILPEPNVIWNPGCQLSFAATAGIIIGTPHNPTKLLPEKFTRNKLWQKIQAFAIDPTYVTLCATLATAPFLIHHFKTLSPFAWFGNIIIVPAISLSMQAGLFAQLSPIDFICEMFCNAARFFLRLASLLTRILSDSAAASITVGPFSPAVLVALGFLILLLPVCYKNYIARKYALLCILVAAALFTFESYRAVLYPSWTLTTIDVGQGDSHLIKTPSGKHFLIDAGDHSRQDSGKDIIVPFLHHTGVSELDALIITHPDKDHFGGALSLLKMFPVKELWASKCAMKERKPEWQQVIREANKRKIPIRNMHRGVLWKENYFEIRTIHPVENRCVEANEGSITLRLKGLGHSAVLTGDLTVAGEKQILKTDVYLKSDVLKLGHHGSKTSSSVKFLNAVEPKYAIVSSGRRNKFRHPHKQVTDRLDSLHIPYINTAKKGTITFKFVPDSVSYTTMW
ncbi:MAG: DNA internalization-related competence protein ComEC/Rec2 [Fibrobacter sp.]|nr:DNA internalization-related competence protein ComEC/Rec2 [Fibrobacter sp.]